MGKRRMVPPPPPDATLEALFRWSPIEDLWLEPRFSELLADAEYFADKAQGKKGQLTAEQGRYARAAVILSLAAIEAASNDALATIRELLGDSWPAEARNDPPWVHFRRLSYSRVCRLLERGRLEKKVDYLLKRIENVPWIQPERDFFARFRQLVLIRNRIVHMKSLSHPRKVPSVLNPGQIGHLARIGAETAREYVDVLDQAFDEMKLPIRVISLD